MTRILLPIILLSGALGLFIWYTNPNFQTIKELSAQNASYSDALDKAQQLLEVRNTLLATRASFSDENIAKLGHMLPDNVDNIRFIIDVNTIASRHRAILSQVQLGSTVNTASQAGALASGPSGSVGSVEIGFTVNATYEDFLAFEEDLEHSLRIIDVSKINFTAGNTNLNNYSFTVKTYWLH